MGHSGHAKQREGLCIGTFQSKKAWIKLLLETSSLNPKNFFAELRRRNVYKVAVAYAVVGWLAVQIATQVFPFFEIPNWSVRLIVLLIVVGFPIALVIAWAFELTPEGLKRTEAADSTPAPRSRRHAWILIVIIAGAMSLGLFFLGRFTAPSGGRSEVLAKSIAVLPFENLSEDKANAYFADGIQDEIVTRLANVGDLKVISRSSTQRYKTKPEDLSEVARQLGVAHFVEGSVQKVGGRVRINVQLIRAGANDHLWAQIYDRDLTDIFAVESELATAIANSLQAKLTGRQQQAVTQKPTNNLEAYDAYLRGIDFDTRPGVNPQNMTMAAKLFSEAVRLDPKFSVAWGKLSEVSSSLYFFEIDKTPERREIARAAAETATRLNPTAPETLFANAYYRYHVERDYAGARSLFEQIHAQVPNSSEALQALAFIARRQSRWNDTIKFFEEAAQLNPRDVELFSEWSWTLSMLRQVPAALEMIDRALAILPNDPELLSSKAFLYQMQGDLAAADQVLLKLEPSTGSETAVGVRVNQLLYHRRYDAVIQFLQQNLAQRGSKPTIPGSSFRLSLAFAQKMIGDEASAGATYRQALAELEGFLREQPTNSQIVLAISAAHAELGNKEAALREGERSLAMLPTTEDPIAGPVNEEVFARIEAQVGESDRAVARLERLLTTPYGAYPITQAFLRLDPIWDPLRSHPRFQEIVSGPEPKTIYH